MKKKPIERLKAGANKLYSDMTRALQDMEMATQRFNELSYKYAKLLKKIEEKIAEDKKK